MSNSRLEAVLTAPDTLAKAAEHARRFGAPDAAERLAELVLSAGGGQRAVIILKQISAN